MVHTTFHSFLRLPYELRMQIWEAACLEQRQSFHAIHYVTVDPYIEIAPLNHNWDDSKPNRSVYLWHAGLWTACPESRKVVTKHWGKQPRPENEFDMYLCCSKEEAEHYMNHLWPEGEQDPKVLMLYSRVDGEHWRQIVHPKQDIFCISADDWAPLIDECQFISEWYHLCDLKRTAIEFDPSWNLSLENKPDRASIEDVPASLEFLLKLLFHHVENRFGGKTILIDRQSNWTSEYPITRSQIRDCDKEYVGMPAYQPRSPIHIVGDSAILEFFDHLDRLIEDDLLRLYCRANCVSPDLCHDERRHSNFNIRHSFSILVRRTNQVESG